MADPGFPVGGRRAIGGGTPTPNVGTFWQKHMQKQKNWILLGGGTPVVPPGSANVTIHSNEKSKCHTEMPWRPGHVVG